MNEPTTTTSAEFQPYKKQVVKLSPLHTGSNYTPSQATTQRKQAKAKRKAQRQARRK